MYKLGVGISNVTVSLTSAEGSVRVCNIIYSDVSIDSVAPHALHD